MKPNPDSVAFQTLADRLAGIQRTIHDSRVGSPVAAHAVTLVGASKTQPVVVLEEAIRLGITDFGENKVQEAEAKWPALKQAYPQLRLHLIGPLQSNKAGEAVALFDVIQTLDRPKIIAALADAMARQSKRPACYIQVNTGEELQKGGVAPRDLPALVAYAHTAGIDLQGLMCIPPAGANVAPHFALLRQLAGDHGLVELSMGMSEDFATAIRLGATQVRIGTRLFGARKAIP